MTFVSPFRERKHDYIRQAPYKVSHDFHPTLKVRSWHTELQVCLTLCDTLKWRPHIHPSLSLKRRNTHAILLRQSSMSMKTWHCTQFLYCNLLLTCLYAYKTFNTWKAGLHLSYLSPIVSGTQWVLNQSSLN